MLLISANYESESCEKFRVVFLPTSFSTWILKIDAFIDIPRVLRARWQK